MSAVVSHQAFRDRILPDANLHGEFPMTVTGKLQKFQMREMVLGQRPEKRSK